MMINEIMINTLHRKTTHNFIMTYTYTLVYTVLYGFIHKSQPNLKSFLRKQLISKRYLTVELAVDR